MNEIKTYINILIESLDKKITALSNILELSIKQSDLIVLEELDLDRFEQLMDKKAKLIDEINLLDHGFGSTYDRVRDALLSKKEYYKEEITRLKEKVSQVSNLTINIKVTEERNKNNIQRHFNKSKNKVKTFKHSRETVNNYYKAMNKTYGNESYFLDKKN